MSCKQNHVNDIKARFNNVPLNTPVLLKLPDGSSAQVELSSCKESSGSPPFITTNTVTATTSSGVCSLQWNTAGTTVAGDANAASAATSDRLLAPLDLTLDPSNTLYISDSSNNRVQKWTTGAGTGTTVAGQTTGAAGANPDQLRLPAGVVVDETGTVIVADSSNDRVMSWPSASATGTMTAGTGKTA
ncbi:unnamed protein product [Rotaria sp. Silwood2]|nr:unnamed protein product [Rotaria sp. Silwood2]CAF4115321.1 unnamed protein product [Rotaria sp. Silwood2]